MTTAAAVVTPTPAITGEPASPTCSPPGVRTNAANLNKKEGGGGKKKKKKGRNRALSRHFPAAPAAIHSREGASGPAQNGLPDRGNHGIRRRRLRDEAECVGRDRTLFHIPSAHHDDGKLAVQRTEVRKELIPIHERHLDIGHDDIGLKRVVRSRMHCRRALWQPRTLRRQASRRRGPAIRRHHPQPGPHPNRFTKND